MNSKTIGSSAVPTEGVASGAASVATGAGGSHEASSYDKAAPQDRWVLRTGASCWMADESCPECDGPIATDGDELWCAECEYHRPTHP